MQRVSDRNGATIIEKPDVAYVTITNHHGKGKGKSHVGEKIGLSKV